MGLLKKAADYIRVKSGIEENREQLRKMEERHRFLLASIHLAQPEKLNLDKGTLKNATARIREEFGISDFETAIHKNDLMFSFHLLHHSDNLEQAIFSYFKVGARTAQNLGKIAIENQIPSNRLIDFGSGYGRVSRFLPSFFQNSEITPSEVKSQAMAFQKEELHFQTIAHSSDFKGFPAKSFDLMLALSVFTHLPKTLFEGWLKTLFQNLNSGGGLVFTYKDLEENSGQIDRGTVVENEQDFIYTNKSEDELFSFVPDSLKNEEYGVAFVTKDYLKKLTKDLGGEIRFLEKDLAPAQSAALLTKN